MIVSATRTPVQNLLQIFSCGTSMQMGEINEIFYRLTPFSGARLQVKPLNGFFRVRWIKRRGITQGFAS